MKKAVIFDMYETLITHYRCPLYFSREMAVDAGISESEFQRLWRTTNKERSTGKITFEEIIQQILQRYSHDSDEVFHKIVEKRIRIKEETFQHLHEEILPLLNELKERGIKIGLISNCFSEESKVIRRSILYPFFDAPCLSWEEGIEKPDLRIFYKCVNQLGVLPEECLYVGDGGSFELEAAAETGMKAVQAQWYVKEQPAGLTARNWKFEQVEKPLEILEFI